MNAESESTWGVTGRSLPAPGIFWIAFPFLLGVLASCSPPELPPNPWESRSDADVTPEESSVDPATEAKRVLEELGLESDCYSVEPGPADSDRIREEFLLEPGGQTALLRAGNCGEAFDLLWWSHEPDSVRWASSPDRLTAWQEEAIAAAWRLLRKDGHVDQPRAAYRAWVRESVFGITVDGDHGPKHLPGVYFVGLEVALISEDTERWIRRSWSDRTRIYEIRPPVVILDRATLKPFEWQGAPSGLDNAASRE